MDEMKACSLPPPMPLTRKKCWWHLPLRVIGGALFSYAIILLLVTDLVAPLGGPREPPSNMSWEEFMKWTDSGAWWKEAVRTSTIVALGGVLLMFIGRKTKSSNQASHATSEPAASSERKG